MPVAARRARTALRERLLARREEIEAAALTRVAAISDPAEVADPTYTEGLRAAVGAALAYGIETTGREGSDPPLPLELLAQARLAARAGIPLDTVLRRYFAGYSLLGYFILEEAARAGIGDGDELKRLLGAHAGLFDRLLAAVADEHAHESEAIAPASGERRRAERIGRLLAGEQAGTAEIPYDFEGWHLGLLAAGAEAHRAVRELAAGQDCRLLCIPREEDSVWAWLGSRRPLDPAGPLSALREVAGRSGQGGDRPCPAIALGEPAKGLPGWRFTHRQALAALAVARRRPDAAVRYAEVALLAAILQDDLLAASLRRLYLEPLERGRDGGKVAKETLRAYLAAGRSVSAAAAALKTKRHTVTNRLRLIEDAIGSPLGRRYAEIEAILALEDLAPAFPADQTPAQRPDWPPPALPRRGR